MASDQPGQIAIGSYIALATDGSSAKVEISQQLALTAEQFAILQEQVKDQFFRPPLFEDLFHVLNAPTGVMAAILRSRTESGELVDAAGYISGRSAAEDTQRALRAALFNSRYHALLVESRAGLGKTREVAELARSLAAEGWTIGVARAADFRMGVIAGPPAIPPGSANVLLVVDDLQQRVVLLSERERPYADRLIDLLSYLDHVFLPSQLFIIATTRNEPHHRLGQFVPDGHPFWRRFEPFLLPDFTVDDLARLLVHLSAQYGAAVDQETALQLVKASDGSPRTLLQNVRRAISSGARDTLITSWQGSQFGGVEDLLQLAQRSQPAVAVSLRIMRSFHAAGVPVRRRYVKAFGEAAGEQAMDSAIDELINVGLVGEHDDELAVFDNGTSPAPTPQASADAGDLSWRKLTDFLVQQDLADFFAFLNRLWIDGRNEELGQISDLLIARSDDLAADGHSLAGNLALRAGDARAAERELTRAIDLHLYEADVFVSRAVARAANREYEGAVADFTTAMAQGRDDSYVYVSRGLVRIEVRRYQEAEEDFDVALERGGDPRLIYTNRGVARLAQEKYGAAEEDFNQAIEAGRQDVPVFVNRGIARALLRRFDEADTDFTRALELTPDDPRILQRRAVNRLQQKRYAEAFADLTRAIARHPLAADYANRALARLGVDDDDSAGAEADLDRAIELDPTLATAYFQRGRLRGLRGAHADADEDFSAAIALGDDSRETRHNRSLARYRIGDLDGAAADLDEWVGRDPFDGNAYYLRGAVRLAQERWADARADMTSALALSGGKISEALRVRGSASLHLGEYEEAEQDLQAALERDPSDPELLHLRGIARLYQDKDAEAEEDFSAALAAGAPRDQLLYRRAVARIKQNRWWADDGLKQAIKLNPGLWEAQFALAVVALRKRRWENAVSLLEQLRAYADSPEIRATRGVARFHQNAFQEAEADFEAASVGPGSVMALHRALFYVRVLRPFRGLRERRERFIADAVPTWSELCGVSSRYPDNSRIQLQVAQSAVDIMAYYAAHGMIEEVYAPWDALRAVARRHSTDEDIQVQFAAGAASAVSIYGLAQSWPATTTALDCLNDVMVSGSSRVAEPVAFGFFNGVTVLGRRGHMEEALATETKLEALAARHPANRTIQRWLALSLKNLLNYWGSSGQWSQVEGTWQRLRDLAAAFVDAVEIQEVVADGAFNVVTIYAAGARVDDLKSALGVLRDLGEKFPASAFIQFQVAKAGGNAIRAFVAEDRPAEVEAARALVQNAASRFKVDSDIQVALTKAAAALLPYYANNHDAENVTGVLNILRESSAFLSAHQRAHPSDSGAQTLNAQRGLLQSWSGLEVGT